MRVLVLNHEYPPIGGGAGNAAHYTMVELARQGYDVRVITSSYGNLPSRENDEGVDVIRVPALRSRPLETSSIEILSWVASATLRAMREAVTWKPDIIHAYFGVPAGAIGSWTKSIFGIPYLISFRGRDVHGGKGEDGPGIGVILRQVSTRVWSRADALVANSHGLKRIAERILPTADVGVIPNGIDTDRFHPENSDERSNGFRVLYVGRLEPYKGVSDLIDAVSMVENSAVSLEIAGDGSMRSDLEAQTTRLGLCDRVTFSGAVERDQIPSAYRRADALCLPSIVEGMSNVVLEGLASGLPVIVTDIPGSRDLVQNGRSGIVIPPASPASIAEAISTISTDTVVRARYATAAREKASTMGWKQVADAYASVYDCILRERST